MLSIWRFASRLGAPVSLGFSYVGSGLGLSDATPETLQNIFEHAPWLLWTYNVICELSERRPVGATRGVPTDSSKRSCEAGASTWQWLHVGSSLLTTVVVIVALARYRPTSERDRLLVAAGLALIVLGSGLGFLYTRDRVGLWAGIGYAMLVFVALATMLERLAQAGYATAATIGLVSVLAVAWTTRTAETYAQLRDTAWDYHLEWTDNFEALGGPSQPQTELLTSLRAVALSKAPTDPRQDPAWTFALFERRYDREGEARRPADEAADNAVVPLSSPFDIRWKPEVDETATTPGRGRAGSADAQRWPGIRAGARGSIVCARRRAIAFVRFSSTRQSRTQARIDTQRFEIVQ